MNKKCITAIVGVFRVCVPGVMLPLPPVWGGCIVSNLSTTTTSTTTIIATIAMATTTSSVASAVAAAAVASVSLVFFELSHPYAYGLE